jgi:rubrerythrin
MPARLKGVCSTMSADIDYSKLSVLDALDLAILVEEEAKERYQELAENLELHNTRDAARFFRFMVGCEAKHGEELSAKRRELFGDQPRKVDRSMLWDVEAPKYEAVRVFMSLQDALLVALQAETKAFNFFDNALPEVEDPDVRDLFSELRQEEVEHQQLVQAEMAKLPSSDGFDPQDFADGPVAK